MTSVFSAPIDKGYFNIPTKMEDACECARCGNPPMADSYCAGHGDYRNQLSCWECGIKVNTVAVWNELMHYFKSGIEGDG